METIKDMFTLITCAALLTADDKPLNTPPPGFVALFDGKGLNGWLANEKDADKHWTIRNGILHYDGKGDSLRSAKDYGDFELYVDWKIGKGGDSGIYLRGNPQVQIWDNKEGSGGLYNNAKNPRKPLVFADNPPGEWNTFKIVMRGDKVTIHLNGKLVVDDVPLENYFERGQPLPQRGPIELQHHGNPLYFRNIFVKELPD